MELGKRSRPAASNYEAGRKKVLTVEGRSVRFLSKSLALLPFSRLSLSLRFGNEHKRCNECSRSPPPSNGCSQSARGRRKDIAPIYYAIDFFCFGSIFPAHCVLSWSGGDPP